MFKRFLKPQSLSRLFRGSRGFFTSNGRTFSRFTHFSRPLLKGDSYDELYDAESGNFKDSEWDVDELPEVGKNKHRERDWVWDMVDGNPLFEDDLESTMPDESSGERNAKVESLRWGSHWERPQGKLSEDEADKILGDLIEEIFDEATVTESLEIINESLQKGQADKGSTTNQEPEWEIIRERRRRVPGGSWQNVDYNYYYRDNFDYEYENIASEEYDNERDLLFLYFLIAANIAIYYSVLLFVKKEKQERFIRKYWCSLKNIEDGKYHTLVTSMFFHGNQWHLFSNMFFLWYLGRKLIMKIGRRKFSVMYALGGIFASSMFLLERKFFLNRTWANEDRRMYFRGGAVGASGAIYSVCISNVLFGLSRTFTFLFSRLLFFELWYISQSKGKSGYAHSAHLGGAILGFLFVIFENLGDIL